MHLRLHDGSSTQVTSDSSQSIKFQKSIFGIADPNEGKGENGRDNGSSDSDVESDNECSPPKRAKCAKRGKKEPEHKWCADIAFTPEPLKSFDNLRMAQGTQCLHAISNYMRKVELKYQHVIGHNYTTIQQFKESCDKKTIYMMSYPVYWV